MSAEHNRRLGIFDSIRGILMVRVVFFHLLYVYFGEEPYHTASALIPCFAMEVFLYIAGLFSQDDYAKSDHVLGRLLLMYAIFQIFYGFLHVLGGGAAPDITQPYYVYWFLLCLVILRFAARYVPKTKTAFVILCLLAVLGGLFPDADWHLSVSNSIAYAPFFWAGLMTDRKKLAAFIEHRSLKHYLAGSLLILAALLTGVLFIRTMNPTLSALQMSPYETAADLLSRLIIYAVSILMTAGLLLCIPADDIPFFTAVGRNSLPVFLLHLLPVFILIPLLSRVNSAWMRLALSLFSAFLLAWLLGRNRVTAWLNRQFDVLQNGLSGNEKPGTVRTVRILTAAVLLLLCGASAVRFL